MKWNDMKWNEMKWNKMKWNEMKQSKVSKIALPGNDFAFDMLYLWRELMTLSENPDLTYVPYNLLRSVD